MFVNLLWIYTYPSVDADHSNVVIDKIMETLLLSYGLCEDGASKTPFNQLFESLVSMVWLFGWICEKDNQDI